MVLPVFDRNPVHRPPVVTWALLALNVLAFLASPFDSAPATQAEVCQQLEFLSTWAAIPQEIVAGVPSPLEPGPAAGEDCLVVPRDDGKIPLLSVLTAMFLHGSWGHLLGNMLFLWIFGNNVEDRLGRLHYLAFYLFCGYAATLGFVLADPRSTVPMVGASGAIAGVMGAYIAMFPRARVWSVVGIVPLPVPAWLLLGSWFAMQAFFSVGVGTADATVAYLAHAVGFVVGFAYVQLYGRRYKSPPPRGGPPPAPVYVYAPPGYPPQGYPYQGYPYQGYPYQGYPYQGYPYQGYPPQGYPHR